MNQTPCPNCGWVHPNTVQVAATKRQRLALVIQHVAMALGIEISEMRSAKRGRHIAEARQLAMAVGRFETRLTFEEIGFALNRDHTTVIHGIESTAARFEKDQQFRAIVRANFPEFARSLESKGAA